jgi:predicted nucleic acid-binding protein
MKRFIVDTSAILDWILFSDDPKTPASRIINKLIQKKISLFAPSFLLVESSNVLKQKYKFTEIEIVEAIQQLKVIGVDIIDIGSKDWSNLLTISFKYDLTLYDSYYVLLAERLDSKIITFDKALLATNLGISPKEAISGL